MARGRPPSRETRLPVAESCQPTRQLEPAEAECFDRWAAVVRSTRDFLPTDGPLLTFVVELDLRKARAAKAAAEIDPYEGGRRHPSLTDWDNAHRDMVALLRELGLTAASMKNVNMGQRRTKEGDALAEYLEG
jgi:phage terminase small subunit